MFYSRAHQLYTYVNKIENGIWWCWSECKSHICIFQKLSSKILCFFLFFVFYLNVLVLWIFFCFLSIHFHVTSYSVDCYLIMRFLYSNNVSYHISWIRSFLKSEFHYFNEKLEQKQKHHQFVCRPRYFDILQCTISNRLFLVFNFFMNFQTISI